MLKKNQDILDSIFKTINFKDEAIAAFREYLKEKQEERYQ
jgi:type III secretory pathway component EscR